jgi:hypothetical protein
MQRLDMQRIADALTARTTNLSATIADFKMITPTLARVVATFNTLENVPREQLAASVGRALDNAATVVEGSWRRLETSGSPAMVGFVTANRETVPYTDETSKNKVVLSSNMLMDSKDDSLWEVRSDGAGGKMLCRQEQDSLKQLMETARVRQPRAPQLERVMSGVDRGNFVAYVNPVTEVLCHGYVTATDIEIAPQPTGGLDLDPLDQSQEGVEILPMDLEPDNTGDETNGGGNRIAQRMRDENAPITVPCALIVESASMNGGDAHAEVAAPANANNKASLTDYYSKLYRYNAPYLALVKKVIDDHAGI